MIVDVIPIIIDFAVSVSWGHVSEYIKSRLELYDSVKDTMKPLFYAASGWVSWVIVFQNIYKLYNTNPKVTSPAPYTDRVRPKQPYPGVPILILFPRWNKLLSSSSSRLSLFVLSVCCHTQ